MICRLRKRAASAKVDVDGAVEEARHMAALQHPAFGEETVGERLVGRGPLGAHTRPVGAELLGRQHGERGVHALAHVDVGDVDGDGVVRADLDPAPEQTLAVTGDEGGGLRPEGIDPGAVAERQPAHCRDRADEEGPALHRRSPLLLHAWSARWRMARRMRG